MSTLKTLRWTTLTLVVAVSLAGCTGSAQHVSRPDALSSSSPSATPSAERTEFPFPTPTPSFEAQTATPLKGYVEPPLLVSGRISPIRGVGIGDVVTLATTVRNTSRTPQKVVMYAAPSSGVIWDLLAKPANAAVSDSCEHEKNGPTCTPSHVEWEQRFAPLETKTLVVKIRVLDYRCPARGDFYRDMFMGVSGPVATGPNSFHAWMLYENDRDDYVYGKGAPPDREWDCDVRITT